MKKAIAWSVLVFTITVSFYSCTPGKTGPRGEVHLVIGKIEILRNNARIPLVMGSTLYDNDVIQTGPDGIVVAALDDNSAEIEIQRNAVFKIGTLAKKKRKYGLDSGNLWMRINKKLAHGEEYLLQTPTSTAAVRGTKFFTFKIGDMTGTCYCEGTVDFQTAGSTQHVTQRQDSLTFTKGNKTVFFTPGELAFMGSSHRHSALDNSPLGQKETPMTPEQLKKLLAAVEMKLAQFKKQQ